MARDIGHHGFETRARLTLASIHARRGSDDQVVDYFTQALGRARATDNRYVQAQALIGLAACVRPHHHALDHGWEARRLARTAGYALLEGQALTVLATIYLTDHQAERTIRTATLAAQIHRRTRHLPGLEHSRRIIDDARRGVHPTGGVHQYQQYGGPPPNGPTPPG